MKTETTTARFHPSPDLLRASARPRLSAQQLQYHVLAPRSGQSPELESAYALWHEIWLQTLHALDGVTHISSDEFTRQDQICVLFSGARALSLVCLRWVDLASSLGRADSYFQHWPPDVLQQLGPRQLGIVSHVGIAPEWRGSLVDAPGGAISLKALTIALSLLSFGQSAADTAIGAARKDRGMDRVSRELGCQRIGQAVIHGILSDIVLWHRSDVNALPGVVHELWARRSERAIEEGAVQLS
jgi:hypothetical protein